MESNKSNISTLEQSITTPYNNMGRPSGINPSDMLVIISLSILIDILTLATILKSKSKLTPTDYYILIFNNFFSTCFKTVGILKNLFSVVDLSFLGIVQCLVSYSLNSDIIFCYFMVMLYYSLYHFSTIQRSLIFRKIYHLIHNPRHFLIYITSITFAYTVFIFVYSLTLQNVIFSSPLCPESSLSHNNSNISTSKQQQCNVNQLNTYTLIPFASYTCFVPTQMVYLMAICIIGWSWFQARKSLVGNNNSVDAVALSKRFKRKLLISAKFFAFSLLSLVISVPQFIVPLLNYILKNSQSTNATITTIFNFLFLIFFSTQTLFLVFIHNRLKRTFIKCYVGPCVECCSCFLRFISNKK